MICLLDIYTNLHNNEKFSLVLKLEASRSNSNMQVNLLIVLTVLIQLVNQALGQANNVIISFIEYLPSNFQETTFRCNGAIIAPQYVITTASCATVEAPYLLGIQFIYIVDDGSVTTTGSVSRVINHPNYVQAHDIEANIAVVNVRSQRFIFKF